MFVLSAVCISDGSSVTAEHIQKPEEILFVFIIAKEQTLNYCTSFFKSCSYSTLKFTFSLFIFGHHLLPYHEIIKDHIGKKGKMSELGYSRSVKQTKMMILDYGGKFF